MKKSKFVLLTLVLIVFLGLTLVFGSVGVNGAQEGGGYTDPPSNEYPPEDFWFLPPSAINYVDVDGRGVRLYIDYVDYFDLSDPFSFAFFYPVQDYYFDEWSLLTTRIEYMEIAIFDQDLISWLDYYANTYGLDPVPEWDRVYIYWDVEDRLFKVEYHGTLLGYLAYRIERLKDIVESEYNRGYYEGYESGFYLGNDLGFEAGYDVGFAEGRIEGYNVGYETGYSEGHDVGYTEGHDVGYETGYDEGLQANNSIVYQKGIDKGYAEGYDVGYTEGHDVGYTEGHDVGYETGYETGYDDARPEMDILLITLIMFLLSIFIYFRFRLKWVLIATILLWFVPIFLIDNLFIRIFSVIMIIVTIVITFFNDREEDFIE